MKKYLFLLCVLPLAVTAQKNNADSIRYTMIKAAVHFYASDDTAFKKATEKTSGCIYPDYDCLLKFCQRNDLQGVDNKISSWNDKNYNSKEELDKLKNKILSEISANKKEYRTKLPGYDTLVSVMSTAVSAFRQSPVATPAGGAPGLDALKPGGGGNGQAMPNLLTWIALLAGIGSLLLSISLFKRRPKKESDMSGNAGSGSLDTTKLESKIAALPDQLLLKADISAMKTLEQKIADMETKLKQLEKRQQEHTNVSSNKTVQPQKKADTAAETAKPFYAKMPDQSNGFSNDIFRSEQNGEQVYEIAVAGNTATYWISNDPGAQYYALNDVNYILGRACTLSNQPFPNCRINTKQKGTLTKTTEGWAIANKAVVEFL